MVWLIVPLLLIILGISVVIIGNFILEFKVRKEALTLFNTSQKPKRGVITEKDIQDLPEPVQRYMRKSQVIGRERIDCIRLKQKGFIRMKEEGNWIPLKAVEYYTVNPPGFIWLGSIRTSLFISVKARDMFRNGKGTMLVKLVGLITIANAGGKEMDQASLTRFLNETMWFPTALLSDYIEWEAVDANSAKATITTEGLSASAMFHFSDEGDLVDFTAERHREEGGFFRLRQWSTPVHEYEEKNGIRIPSQGYAAWHLSSGEFDYIKLEITDIEYNNPRSYM